MVRQSKRTLLIALAYLAVAASGLGAGRWATGLKTLRSGLNGLQLAGIVALVLGGCALFSLATQLVFARRRQPVVEGLMLTRLYWLVAGVVAICSIAIASEEAVGRHILVPNAMLFGPRSQGCRHLGWTTIPALRRPNLARLCFLSLLSGSWYAFATTTEEVRGVGCARSSGRASSASSRKGKHVN